MSQLTFPLELWEGFTPSHVEQYNDTLTIHLEPTSRPLCQCGVEAQHIHDTTIRRVSERAILDYSVTLMVPVRRLLCPQCGKRTEHISWLKPFSRITERLASLVQSLCPILPIKHLAQLVGLHWHTVKELDKARLRRDVHEPEWGQVKRLVMDEFALFKDIAMPRSLLTPTHIRCSRLEKAEVGRPYAPFLKSWANTAGTSKPWPWI